MEHHFNIIAIGAGAAGYFSAISAAEANHTAKVGILEKSGKTLSKLRISGGGRCNVTHACFDHSILTAAYPRGNRELRSAFSVFDTQTCIDWFESRGVTLKTEADGRMFPITDSSETVARCLELEAERLKVELYLNTGFTKIELVEGKYVIETNRQTFTADKLIICTGGNPNVDAYNWLANFNIAVVPPTPSLFSIVVDDVQLKELAGLSVTEVQVGYAGTKISTTGAILVTHKGLSGPAILRLSAFAAKEFAAENYHGKIWINWMQFESENESVAFVAELKKDKAKQLVSNTVIDKLPKRLVLYLIRKAGIIEPKLNWADLNKQQLNALSQLLYRMPVNFNGKNANKDEFVTAGGVSLKAINQKSMEAKNVTGLYFCGEVIDVDGVTGGFNFQAAWTTGYIAGRHAANFKQ
ncbi:MAG: NAD(P)/FAD-dependent oxidoreductase [Bacteroidota bacterium]|nr:NAD(P)/FAD-dependent oxidoreductase [Bacteroidota bacterium]